MKRKLQINIIFIILLFIFLLVACRRADEDHKSVIIKKDAVVIRFSLDGKGSDVPFCQSEILDSIRYVKIDSSIVMQQAELAKYCNGKLYMLDRLSHKIIVIGEDGQYVSSVNHRGRAKDEYLGIFKFDVNSSNGQILIYDQAGDKILIYDENGNFVRCIELFGNYKVSRDFAVFSNGNMLGCYLDYDRRDKPDFIRGVWMLDSLGNFIKYLYQTDKSVKYSVVTNQHFCNIDGETIGFLPEVGNDTIYNFNKNGEISAKYVIDCGKKVDRDFLKKEFTPGDVRPNNYYMYRYFETPRYMIISAFCSKYHNNIFDQMTNIFFDKKNRIPHISTSQEHHIEDMIVPSMEFSSSTHVFNMLIPNMMSKELLDLFSEELQGSATPLIQIARYRQ